MKTLRSCLSAFILATSAACAQPLLIAEQDVMIVPASLSGGPSRGAYYEGMDYAWVSHLVLNGAGVELGDGSQWKVCPSDLYKLESWSKGDSIILTQCHSPFSSYNYYLTNKSREGFFTRAPYVRVNLHQGPFSFGPNTHWIVGINYETGQVNLENGSFWNIASEHIHLFNEWAVNDTILIGVNDHPLTFSKSILINVNMNTCTRADRF